MTIGSGWMAALAIAAIGGLAPASSMPPPDGPALSPVELAVYEAVLAKWLGDDRKVQLVDRRLGAAPRSGDADLASCAKGLGIAPTSTGPASLEDGGFRRSGIRLIDGATWRPADPGAAIAAGKSVDEAAKAGFDASLISLSRIAFSRDGNHAFVKFSMVCGSLCGSGSTMHLRKRGAGWQVADDCGGGWIS